MQYKADRWSWMDKRYLHLQYEWYANSTETPLSHDRPVGSAKSGLNWQKKVLSVKTTYDENGLETKKLLNIGLGWEMIVNMNIPVYSASPVSFIKQNILHELKLRCSNLNFYPVERKIRDLYCGFTDDTINILGKIIVNTQSNGWIREETPFFITGGHERNFLGNDNLSKIRYRNEEMPPVNLFSRPNTNREKVE